MIVADIRAALDLGALNRAADLLVVLRLFLSDHPEARRCQDRNVVDLRPAPMQEPRRIGAPKASKRDHADASVSHIERYRKAAHQ
jgi:hypothetical protein